MARGVPETEQTIDVETSGNAVSLHIDEHSQVFFHVDGATGNEYQIDVKRTAGSWIQNVGSAFTGSANYTKLASTMPVPEVRLRCSSGTGTPGDTATITITASG